MAESGVESGIVRGAERLMPVSLVFFVRGLDRLFRPYTDITLVVCYNKAMCKANSSVQMSSKQGSHEGCSYSSTNSTRRRTGSKRTPRRGTYNPYRKDWRQYITCCALEVRKSVGRFLNCWFTTPTSTQICSSLVSSS